MGDAAANFVQVTNTSDEVLEGGYDGKAYVFEPGKPEVVPAIVATHIFGFRQKDKSAALARLGVLKMSNDRRAALAYLDKFRVEPVQFAPRALDDEPVGDHNTEDMTPAPQIGSVSPQSLSDGTEGAGESPAPEVPLLMPGSPQLGKPADMARIAAGEAEDIE